MAGFSAGAAWLDVIPRMGRGWDRDLNRQLDGPLGGIQGRMAGAGKAIAKGLAVGIAGGAAIAAVGLKGALDSASDLNEATNVTGLIFKESRGEIDRFVESSYKLGLSETKARELSGTIGGLLQNLGLSDDATVDWSKKLVTLGADMGSAFNAEPAEAIEAIGSALRGESEPIRRFNVVLSDAAVQAEALRLGLVEGVADTTKVTSARVALEAATRKVAEAEKEHGKDSFEAEQARAALGTAEARLTKELEGTVPALTDAQKTQARLSLITRQTAAVQGDFANTSDGAANSQRVLQARMENLKAKIGTAFLPIWTALLGIIGDKVVPLLERVLPRALAFVQDKLVELRTKLAPVWARFLEVAALVRDRLEPAFESVASFLRDNLQPVLITLGVALGVLFGIWVAGAIAAAVASLAAAAIPLLIALAVGALVAAFVLAYQRIEGFRTFVDGIVEWAKRELPKMWDRFVAGAKVAWEWVKTNVPPIWAQIVAGARVAFGWLQEHVPPIVAAVVAAIQTAVQWLVTNVPPIVRAVGAVLASIWEWLRTNVPPIVAAVVAAVVSSFNFLRDTVWPIVQQVFGGLVDIIAGVVAFAVETWPAFTEAVMHVFNVLRPIVEGWVNFARWQLENLIGVIIWLWENVGTRIVTVVSLIVDQVMNILGTFYETVQNTIRLFLSIINGDWGEAWDAIKDQVSNVLDFIWRTIQGGGDLILNALEGVLGLLREAWDAGWEAMKDVLGGLWDGVTDGAKAALNMMLAVLEDGINLAIDLLNNALDGIDKAAGPLVNFGEIPEVEIPRLERGGRMAPGSTAIVGDRGNDLRNAELFRAGAAGGRVFPHSTLVDLLDAARAGTGRDAPLWDGDLRVDGAGIDDPETLADLLSRVLFWRLGESLET